MTADVEVEVERLDGYTGGELDAGFVIEDARLDASASLAGAEAGSGQVTNVLLDGVRASASRCAASAFGTYSPRTSTAQTPTGPEPG